MKDGPLAKGILYIALIPVLLSVLVIVVLHFSLLEVPVLFVIVAYPSALYLLYLLHKNSYSDLEVLDRVDIPNAPSEITSLLKTQLTKGTNRLVNVALVTILWKKKLSQTDVTKQLNNYCNTDYSIPAITKYLSDLENAHIIKRAEGAYKIEYSLTPKGEWCYEAVKKCFPKRFFLFVVRHYLGRKKLPPYPNEAS